LPQIKMLTYITLGFAGFAVALVALAVLHMYKLYKLEGFGNMDQAAATAATTAKITPGSDDERSKLTPGGALDSATEHLITSAALPAMNAPDALKNWGAMSSEVCYRSDASEALKPTRNYLQRTNNYQRSHPDSCSAPNHEFIGTFYAPFDGVGRTPPCSGGGVGQ
jgi:hypothetical protein